MEKFPPFNTLLNDLFDRGYSYQEDFFPESFCQEILGLQDALPFKKASIGKGAINQQNAEIRSDAIYWISEDSPNPLRNYLKAMEEYRSILNREFFLGLNSYEGHLAKYPVGSFYKKHLDQHRGSKERVITTILYLNGANQEKMGGEIRIYKKGSPSEVEIDLTPKAGMFLTFLSDQLYHEVLTSHFERFSLTGWLRTNTL